jgi:hypothetical protein
LAPSVWVVLSMLSATFLDLRSDGLASVDFASSFVDDVAADSVLAAAGFGFPAWLSASALEASAVDADSAVFDSDGFDSAVFESVDFESAAFDSADEDLEESD